MVVVPKLKSKKWSYSNQPIDLLCKSMDGKTFLAIDGTWQWLWFQDNDLVPSISNHYLKNIKVEGSQCPKSSGITSKYQSFLYSLWMSLQLNANKKTKLIASLRVLTFSYLSPYHNHLLPLSFISLTNKQSWKNYQ